ncbi:MAG: hypothetical protein ACREAZ_10365 [Nitrososphaera sp.]
MVGTIITCISDEENFAKDVYESLYAELKKEKKLEDGRNLQVTSEAIRFAVDNNEIHIDETCLVPREMIKWILESFLKSNPSRFKEYRVIELGNTFTIGRILHPSQLEMSTCEICGFFTPYSEELQTHRMTHFGI